MKMHNFRLYFIGQAISVPGGWMQGIAQSWLILQLTNSGTALGIVNALSYFPVLFLSPFAGLIIDKFSKRKILYVTQTLLGVSAIALGYLTISGEVRVWMIYLIALFNGLVSVVDIPTRQVFIPEMVGEGELKNAITLNSILMNISRIIGPTIAGIIIVMYGTGPCFIFNGVSFLAFIFVIFAMRSNELHSSHKQAERSRFFEGFHHIISKPELKVTLLMMAILGTFAYEFPVTLALLAKKSFHGDARSFAVLTAAMGVGAVLGGMISAGKKKVNCLITISSAFFFGLFIVLASFAPNILAGSVLLAVVGFFSISFMTVGNATMQIGTPVALRGRVMVFWTMAFSGSTAIGAPIVGWIGQHLGSRASLAIGGVASIFAAVLGFLILKKNGVDVFAKEEIAE